MKYKIKRKHKTMKTWQILIIFVIALLFLSISYASISTTLRINGTATGERQQLDVIYLHINNSSSYPSTIAYMDTYSYTFEDPPVIGNISMGGINLTLNTDYTYTNGTLTIPDVTGTLVIDGEQIELQNFNIKYVYGDNIQFDGNTMLDTGIALFSAENFDRDFDLTVDIDNSTYVNNNNQTYNTVVNCVDHDNTPYHGFTLRRNASKYFFKRTVAQNSVTEIQYNPDEIQNVRLSRTNKVLYGSFSNGSSVQQIGDYSNLNQRIDYNLLIGSDLNDKNQSFRCFVGQLSNITVTNYYEGEEVPVTLPLAKRTGYTFKGWYSDSEFTRRVGRGGEAYTPSAENNILYAKWVTQDVIEQEEEYNFNGQYNFAQNGYINTSVYLYTQENIHRNFEMSFNIVGLGSSINNDTLMSATKNILRINNAANQLLTLDTVGNTSGGTIKNIPNTITNVRIIRINDKLYYSLNGQTFLLINDYTGYTDYSNNPVIFGADFNTDGTIYRSFDGVLSNMSVKFISDSATLADYESPQGELATVYSHSGNFVFDGTNNIDTNIRLFDYDTYDKDFEISFNIVSKDSSTASQATLVNSKYENKDAGYPGFVYRFDTTLANLELTAAKATSGSPYRCSFSSVNSVKISRRDMKLYIQINDGTEQQVYDFSGFKDFFSTKLTIGSAIDSSGNIFRPFIGILSDIVVKLEQ